MSVAAERVARPPVSTGSKARDKVTGRGDVRVRVRASSTSRTRDALCSTIVEGRASARSTRARRSPQDGIARRADAGRTRRSCRRPKGSSRCCSRRRSPTAARSSAVVIARELRGGSPRRAARPLRVRRGGARRRPARRPSRRSTSRTRSTRASRPTPRTATSRAALKEAVHTIDETYTTPAEHNNPMEPHATLAFWEGPKLTLYDSNQGAYAYSEIDRQGVRHATRERARDRPPRRRRLRLEGDAAAARHRRGDGRAAGRAGR